MTTPPTDTRPPRRVWRSVGAVFLGFITVFVLSLGTDHVLHVLKVYPPWGQPMYDTGLYLLALTYRSVYTVAGGFVTARFAPHSPMRHVWVLAIVGFVVAIVGAIATIPMRLGPAWYPIALALTGPLFVWLGGVLYQSRQGQR
jgi:hypothetical protein